LHGPPEDPEVLTRREVRRTGPSARGVRRGRNERDDRERHCGAVAVRDTRASRRGRAGPETACLVDERAKRARARGVVASDDPYPRDHRERRICRGATASPLRAFEGLVAVAVAVAVVVAVAVAVAVVVAVVVAGAVVDAVAVVVAVAVAVAAAGGASVLPPEAWPLRSCARPGYPPASPSRHPTTAFPHPRATSTCATSFFCGRCAVPLRSSGESPAPHRGARNLEDGWAVVSRAVRAVPRVARDGGPAATPSPSGPTACASSFCGAGLARSPL
jgi:hypothetical protein